MAESLLFRSAPSVPRLPVVGMTLALFILSACQSMHESPDYERHSSSQISVPLEGGDFYWFDVKLTAELPANSDVAEAQRMRWLESWLALRKVCAEGYEILERREFGFLEHNPARYDLRYKVRCSATPQGA